MHPILVQLLDTDHNVKGG